MLADSYPGESPIPGLQTTAFSLCPPMSERKREEEKRKEGKGRQEKGRRGEGRGGGENKTVLRTFTVLGFLGRSKGGTDKGERRERGREREGKRERQGENNSPEGMYLSLPILTFVA